jgi:hypothetical protein
MMNDRNHVNIKLCSNEKQVDKLIAKLNSYRKIIFSILVAIRLNKIQIQLK